MNPNGSHWIRDAKRVAIYERDSWECAYCGRGPRDKRDRRQASVILSLDHLVPRNAGGSNAASNLVTACIACNSARGDRPVEGYATAGALERITYLVEQPIDIEFGKALMASINGDDSTESAR